MVIAVRTERGSTGLEVVKIADDDIGRARLVREAEILQRAAHPGIVEVVAITDSSLRLRHRGTPLGRLGAISPDHAAALVRATAGIVDSLHQQGIVHRRIDRDHIVISERGRPHLCGFAEAGDGEADERADDVAALGRLLDELLDAGADALWSPEHRGVRAANRRRKALAGFRTAAAGAQRPASGQRLTARQFATAIGDALPGLSLPTPPGAESDTSSEDFGAIPHDIDPTADLGWSDLDLSVLAVDDDVDFDENDGREPGAPRRRDPYAALAALAGPEPTEPEPTSPDAPRPFTPQVPEPHPGAAEQAQPGVDPIVAALRAALAYDAATEGEEGRAGAAGPADSGGEGDAGSEPADPLAITIRPGRIDDVRDLDGDDMSARRVPLAVVAAVVLAIGVVAGAAIARAIDPFGADTASASSSALSPTTTTVTPADSTTGSSPVPSPAPGCPQVSVPGPDADGDGCPSEIALDGRTAEIDGITVELGQDGDLVTVADADCDGVATPVLLRPDTGEVFVFDEWSLDEAIEVSAVAVVDGATAIEPGDGPCEGAVVLDASGGETEVPS